MSLMLYITTATELQRNYRKVVRKAKKAQRPITVLSNNKPELVVMDYQLFSQWSGNLESSKKTKNGLDALFGAWTKEEAGKFDAIIEDAFERIDIRDWK